MLLIIFTVLIIFGLWYFYSKPRSSLKPDPPGHFLFGQWLESFQTNPFDLFLKYWKEYDRGDGIFRLWLVHKPLYIVSGKKHIDTILELKKDPDYDFIRGEVTDAVREIFGDKNIATLEDEPYLAKRGMVHEHFGTPKIPGYSKHFHDIIETELASLSSGPLTVSTLTGKIIPDIMGAIFVHQEHTSQKGKETIREFNEVMKVLKQFLFTPYPRWFKWFYGKLTAKINFRIPFLPEPLQPPLWHQHNLYKEKYHKEFDGLLDILLEEKRVDYSDGTMFNAIYNHHREEIEATGVLPDEFKRDVGSAFFGGTDTTTSLIMWALIELDRHPEAKRRLVKEIDSKFKDGAPSLDDVNQFVYLQAVIMETLRLYPGAIGILRNLRIRNPAIKEVTMGPYTLKHGDMTLVYIYGANRSKEWGSDPDEWNPERMVSFYQEHQRWPSEDKAAHFMTFSNGQHKCPGRRVSIPITAYFLILFLKKFDFKVDPTCNVKPRAMSITYPTDELKITLISRA